MFDFYLSEYEKLKSYLNDISLEFYDVLLENNNAIEECLKALKTIRGYFNVHPLVTSESEILFFKTIKPLFTSRLIYHLEIFNVESNIPNGSNEVKVKYYHNQLKKNKHFFDENRSFYRYYRTKSNYLDDKYFIRGKHDIHLNLSTHTFEYDSNFSTSHDFIVAKILANDLIQIYIEEQLETLKFADNKNNIKPDNGYIKWTGSKIALIELIYALHSTGVINHGSAEIKHIANITERLFKIKLGDYYRAFLEIRMRKTGRTKFIDTMKELLIKRMDETDEGK